METIAKRATGLLIALFSIAACVLAQQEETIGLKQGWKFAPGDDLAYAAPGFDDAAWVPIRVDTNWEYQGYEKLDGFAWYRLKVFIPSRLKDNAYLKDGLRVFLGKINNFDQSFLNGTIIGINGKAVGGNTTPDTAFTKADAGLWNYDRTYVLPMDDPRILWDKENVIAVRVFDAGGLGGIFSGNLNIRVVNIGDYLEFNYSAHPFVSENQELRKIFLLRNTSSTHTIKGTLTIQAQNNVSLASLFREVTDLELTPQTSKEFTLKLNRQDQSSRVNYRFEFAGGRGWATVDEEVPYILTPPAPESPRINGAKICAARPGHPFQYMIVASGRRPITFAANNLPAGLVLNPETGIITGTVKERGEYRVSLSARNSKGKDGREMKIVIGDQIALTPPLGWNSWNCWGLTVDEGKVLASAKVFKEKGLMNHGWTYINIDDGWEIVGTSQQPKRDAQGNILTNEKFRNMKALGDSIHALGLKWGIYSSPGPLTCGGYTASYQHELNDARSYSSWGIDYLKYDWCSYDKIAKDTSRAEFMAPYALMRKALNEIDRDIVFSLCQYGMGRVWEWGAMVGGNLWRTTDDITDTWESMSGIGFNQISNALYAGPGHWNDPDMLVVGWVGWGPSLHPTRLTPDEQYAHISLWCLLSAPLLIGCDLERLDDFSLNLLTNDEVLAVDQDPLGRQAVPVLRDGNIQVWVKPLEDGNKAIGIFNLGSKPEKYALELGRVFDGGKASLRDLWRQKNLGTFDGKFESFIPSHGVVMLKTGQP